MVYYSERKPFKLSLDKMQGTESRKGPHPELPVVTAQWKWDNANLSQQWHVTIYTEYCPPGKLPKPEFLVGLGHVCMVAARLAQLLQPLWKSGLHHVAQGCP